MKGSYKNSKSAKVTSKMEDEDEDIPEFQILEVEKLQECGINMADINKLKNAGYSSVKALIMATKKQLQSIKGITDQKAEKLQEAASKLDNAGFMTGYDLMMKRYNIFH